MPYPRVANPSPEEAAEYADVDALKARIEQVTEQRTEIVDQYMMPGTSDQDEVRERRLLLAEARDLSIIHQSMLAELATKE